MKIQYCSDLHLEYELNSKYLINHPLEVSGEVLILAGDIIPFHDEFLNNPFFDFISKNYKQVFWVPGNHESYYKDISELTSSFIKKIGSNIKVVNNVEVEYEGIRFVFSALWSKINPDNEKLIQSSLPDFSCITDNNKKLRPSKYNKLYEESLMFIQSCLEKHHEKTVVVTHFLPSTQCNDVKHLNSQINDAFCTDMTPFIETCQANFWIYGHSHYNQKPLFIGETVLLTNQLGAVQWNENIDFKSNAFISI
jgi:Icc-related predicted phosphoesterase